MSICNQLQFYANRLFIFSLPFLLLIALLLGAALNVTHAASTETSVYGAWTVQCQPENGNPTPACVATQLVSKGNDARQVVIGVTVGYEAQHSMPHIIFRVSPGANTHKGAAVKIDQQAHVSIPITNCDKQICEVRSFIPNVLLEQMQQGKMLQFAFFIKNQQITYPVSLEGFSQTYQLLVSNHTLASHHTQ
ncbi:MAG: invasion associated locus B family protein [Glaciecola sp.]|nr:invasion associated locus B family protein [Glaciecola sp.]MDG1815144.1 invasion associated locus B family protein [Glaciecola sp.]MDG2100603.1 invasion associated locus B family protein [Glaciecola sp.]